MSLVPFDTGHPLIRVGGSRHGAYLIPQDLRGITDCFSPGVNTYKRFEDELSDKGIRCHMCDGRVTTDDVETPIKPDGSQTFRNKWLEPIPAHDAITIEQWIDLECHNGSKGSDFLLQMDVEGAEYRILLGLPVDILLRFRIIVLELHFLDWALFDSAFLHECLAPTVYKLCQFFRPVHVHPNNVTRALRFRPDVYIPKLLEVTFLRKDRIRSWPLQRNLPHELDILNVESKKPITLGKPWTFPRSHADEDTFLKAFCTNNSINYQECYLHYLRTGASATHRLTIENYKQDCAAFNIAINPTGRFGNGIRQMFIAFLIAVKSRAESIVLGDFLLHAPYSLPLTNKSLNELFPRRVAGVTFSLDLLSPEIPNVISGPFMHPQLFPAIREISALHEQWIEQFAEDILQPLAGFSFDECSVDDSCAVHIRSGDIFSKRIPNPWYAQPPLEYYKFATNSMINTCGVDHFYIVYQDLGNPVIEPYTQWLKQQEIPFTVSNSSFAQDFAHMVRCKYIVSSKGTLAPAAVLISGNKTKVFCYESFDSVGMPFSALSKFNINIIKPKDTNYIPAGQWINSIEQREMMCSYKPDLFIEGQ